MALAVSSHRRFKIRGFSRGGGTKKKILVMGSFVADLAFRAARLPAWGETLMGSSFALGPGGKGSNQAVACARAGAKTKFFSKLGDDAFGKIARELWAADGIDASLVGTSEPA